jgi:lipoate-protein ligase B
LRTTPASKPLCNVVDLGALAYRTAFDLQKREVARLQQTGGDETLFFVEHPHVLTVGRNANGDAILADRDLLARKGVEVVDTDRGGDVTYHGPGQLVGYPIMALSSDRRDIRRYVSDIEEVLIRTLESFGVRGRRHPVHRGVWTENGKIASVGIRISRWVTCHGFALNVSTDLSFFSLLHPCGIVGCEMTSMERELGAAPDMSAVKTNLVGHYAMVFERETCPVTG